MVLGDVYDLWSFVATHVKLWKSLKEHDVFIAYLKRLGSDDNNTSTADGVSPLKHVGPISKFDKLYKTHYHTIHCQNSYQNLYHPGWTNGRIHFVMFDISQKKQFQNVYYSL